tara:strand:- start:2499 stop:3137 length:639 start_codon:yes stop_codon:yes gene_type:complete
MGWFSRSDTTTPTQQFGAPSTYGAAPPAYGMSNNMMGGGMGGMGGMDPMMMQQQMQNPFMQQMANDPVMATSRLLQYYDPVSSFMVSANMGTFMDLFTEILSLSMKDFFSNVTFVTDAEGKITLDLSSMPQNMITLSPENVSLTLQRLQTSCNNQLQMNQQQTQMLLQAHNPMMSGQNQPGFFGSLLGGVLGQQMQNGGGMGMGTMAAGAML